MNAAQIDLKFWLVVVGAALARVVMAEGRSWPRSAIALFAAIFAAGVFTRPLVHWLGLPPAIYTEPLAALMALTGEGLMRWIIGVANDPLRLLTILRMWRNGK